MPEMLAAFITPNHTAIVPIIKRAASILGQWTDNPSLDEYQSRTPDRVRKQMAAIYTAITEQQIIYSTIPASFEEYGQRVRLVRRAARGTSACVTWHRLSALLPASSTGWMKLLFKKGEKL